MKKLSIISLFLLISSMAFGATLTVTTVSETAQTITATNATESGDVVPNVGEDVILRLENTNGSSTVTVTITAQNTSTTKTGYGTLTKSDASFTLTANQIKWVGPFPAKAYNNGSDQIELTYSGAGASEADVEIIAIKGSGLRYVP